MSESRGSEPPARPSADESSEQTPTAPAPPFYGPPPGPPEPPLSFEKPADPPSSGLHAALGARTPGATRLPAAPATAAHRLRRPAPRAVRGARSAGGLRVALCGRVPDSPHQHQGHRRVGHRHRLTGRVPPGGHRRRGRRDDGAPRDPRVERRRDRRRHRHRRHHHRRHRPAVHRRGAVLRPGRSARFNAEPPLLIHRRPRRQSTVRAAASSWSCSWSWMAWYAGGGAARLDPAHPA